MAPSSPSSSLRSVVEVALHFEAFRNIDLFHQGLYHLKTRLYREHAEDDNRRYAVPYGHLALPAPAAAASNSSKGPSTKRPDHHHLIPAHIIEDQYTLSTRSFLVRYCEEEVELNDIGQFRVEFAPDEDDALMLEVDLMFADLAQHGGADRFGMQPDVDTTEFKSVSTQVFRLLGARNGMHEFCQVVFDEFHFCVANVTVHSVLLDVRMRLRPALSLAECVYGGSAAAERRAEGTTWLSECAQDFRRQHVDALYSSQEKIQEWVDRVLYNECFTPAQLEAFQEAAGNIANGRGPDKPSPAPIAASDTERSVAAMLAMELCAASSKVIDVWSKALHMMLYACPELTASLRIAWERQVSQQWSVSIVRESAQNDIMNGPPLGKDPAETRLVRAEQVRKHGSRQAPKIRVEDTIQMPRLEARPVLFEQRYTPGSASSTAPPPLPSFCPSEPKMYRGVHLFVLVHGFQGNSFDMRLMKNNIALLYPDSIILCSSSNEENTEGDISDMGIRLAQEVVNYVSDWCTGSTLGRLSFVAHSMGGLIVRAALPLLHEYASKMYTFMTFSTSHLGVLQDKLSLFNTGFWVLKHWRKSLFLQQYSMTDSADCRESFLYRLSKSKGFEYFQHICLVSCYEDQYGPFESARAEIPRGWEGQADKEIYREMVQNIWGKVDLSRVMRFDVNFYLPEKNLDSFIGRAAHIQFLENQPIMRMLVHNYGYMFR